MTRFLHTADWQIGRQYARFAAEDAAALSEARFAVVERIAALAQAENVTAVLVAGDVFDTQTVSERTLRRLFNALAAYPGPWIMIPGNHDAALAESVWTRAQRLGVVPANVHLALQPQVLEFAAAGFAVLPAPLRQRHTHEDLTAWFDEAETGAGLLRIGLAHGSVTGVLAADIDSPNPIAADRAQRARLDYLALGDWHGCRQLDARSWYAGTPEQDRFKANAPGNVLLLELAAPGAEPVVELRSVGAHRWFELNARLAVPSDLEQLLAELAALPAAAVVALTVSGELDLAQRERLQQALAAAEARVRSLQADLSGVQLALGEQDLAGLRADGYVAAVIDELRMRAAAEDETSLAARDALLILAGMLGKGVGGSEGEQ